MLVLIIYISGFDKKLEKRRDDKEFGIIEKKESNKKFSINEKRGIDKRSGIIGIVGIFAVFLDSL